MKAVEPALRAIVLLREVDQLSFASLSDVLVIPAVTVASRPNRSRRELRAAMIKADTPYLFNDLGVHLMLDTLRSTNLEK